MKSKLKNLPINQKYELISVSKNGIESANIMQCDNCSRSILNFATIKGCNDKKIYTVGLDCLDNILHFNTLFSPEAIFEYNNKKDILKKCVRLLAEIEKKKDEWIKYKKIKTYENLRVLFTENKHFNTVGYKIIIDCDIEKDYTLYWACTIPEHERELWLNILSTHKRYLA